jgi:hypothetical protein
VNAFSIKQEETRGGGGVGSSFSVASPKCTITESLRREAENISLHDRADPSCDIRFKYHMFSRHLIHKPSAAVNRLRKRWNCTPVVDSRVGHCFLMPWYTLSAITTVSLILSEVLLHGSKRDAAWSNPPCYIWPDDAYTNKTRKKIPPPSMQDCKIKISTPHKTVSSPSPFLAWPHSTLGPRQKARCHSLL